MFQKRNIFGPIDVEKQSENCSKTMKETSLEKCLINIFKTCQKNIVQNINKLYNQPIFGFKASASMSSSTCKASRHLRRTPKPCTARVTSLARMANHCISQFQAVRMIILFGRLGAQNVLSLWATPTSWYGQKHQHLKPRILTTVFGSSTFQHNA